MDRQGKCHCRLFANAHSWNSNPNAPAERTCIVVGGQKHREEIAEQSGSTLLARKGTDEVMSSSERCQTSCELAGHVGGRRSRTRGPGGQPCRNCEEVLHPVAHLTSQEFMSLFGLLSASHIE